MLVQRWFGWTRHQTPCGLVLWGPPGMGPARSPRGRREHGSRPLRLASRQSVAAGRGVCRRPPWRAIPWREKQPRPHSTKPWAGPRREGSRGWYYLEAGRVRRPSPSRFQVKAQIMVVKGGPCSRATRTTIRHVKRATMWHASPVLATIVYADERLVAVNKPAGVSLATRRAEPHAAVARLLAALPEAERLPYGLAPEDLSPRPPPRRRHLGAGRAGSRFGGASRPRARLRRTPRDKAYLALVWGRPRPHRGTWEWPLGPDRSDRRRMRVDDAGRRSVTGFELIARAPHVALLRLEPATGRTHQLRVHLAHAGHPIVGDDLYGGPRHRGVRDGALRSILAPSPPFPPRLASPPSRRRPRRRADSDRAAACGLCGRARHPGHAPPLGRGSDAPRRRVRS